MTGKSLLLISCLAATAAASAPLAGQDAGSKPGDEFRTACIALSETRIGHSRNFLLGRDGWVYHDKELAHAVTRTFWGEHAAVGNPFTKPDLADPIPAIVDFNDQLAALGVELIFVPVPGRPVVYPEGVLGKARFADLQTIPVLNTAHSDFLAEVRRHGVHVLDLLPLFMDERQNGKEPLFCRLDVHWTPRGIRETAEALAALITSKPWYEAVPRSELNIKMRPITRPGPILKKLREMGLAAGHEEETFTCRRVKLQTEQGSHRLELRNPDSPIVIIGDSYSIWWNDVDAGLAQELAAEFGFPVDSLSTTGGGTTASRLNLVRTMRSEPGYLEGKKLLIWCFGGRSLSTSKEGWRKVPLSAPRPN